MKPTLSIKIDSMRLLGSVICTKPLPLAVNLDLSAKAVAILGYAKKLGLVINRSLLTILEINVVRDISKVFPAVIRWIAIDVINVMGRPMSRGVKPDYLMGFEVVAINGYLDSTITTDVSSNGSSRSAPPSITAGEQSGFRIVIEKISDALLSRFHDVISHLGWTVRQPITFSRRFS